MFKKLAEWREKRRIVREISRMISNVSKFIKDNFDTDQRLRRVEDIAVTRRYWQCGDFTLVHSRFNRGDVIAIFADADCVEGTHIVSWVDQSHFSGGIMGINDLDVKSFDDIEGISLGLQFFRPYADFTQRMTPPRFSK